MEKPEIGYADKAVSERVWRQRRSYRAREGVVTHRMGEELVLVHPTSPRGVRLNRADLRVWGMLSEGTKLPEIKLRLALESNSPLEDLSAEVDRLFDSLFEARIVEPRGE